MNIIRYPERSEWAKIVERPHLDMSQLNETVASVLADVKRRGDDAVKGYELKFDHVDLPDLAVSEAEMNEAEKLVSTELKAAIMVAHHNIQAFHEAQKFRGKKIETQPGVTCWQKSIAIEKVGLYIPGGTAPLFSTVLMLATPAKIAGCQEIVLCTPPGRDGKVNPAILVAARIAGVSKIFKAGGVQAIGAMAYGTASIPKVYKIFGPGNQYVMAAKQQVSLHDVAIDMPAGKPTSSSSLPTCCHRLNMVVTLRCCSSPTPNNSCSMCRQNSTVNFRSCHVRRLPLKHSTTAVWYSSRICRRPSTSPMPTPLST